MEDISIHLLLKFVSHPGTRHPIARVPRQTPSMISACLTRAKGNEFCKKQSTQGHISTKTWLMEEKKEESKVMY